MKKSSLRKAGSLCLTMAVLSLMLAQPLWAEESATPQVKQEESFFASLKRDLDEWLGRKKPDDNTAKNEAPPKDTELKPQKPAAQKPVAKQQSDGRKALNTFKKEMNRISDNISESMERDKKTLKKKLDKLNSKK
ncbi:MAG: hypothetical protein OEY26_00470 [Nitrospinota bacterium]|nr:hypothetical protein [Nitrospinota bacterium]MDH5788983.1 hypothetical protein [Nitrospinota bacterium]